MEISFENNYHCPWVLHRSQILCHPVTMAYFYLLFDLTLLTLPVKAFKVKNSAVL